MRGIGHKESTTSGSPCKEHPHERSLRDSGCVGHKESTASGSLVRSTHMRDRCAIVGA